MTSGFDLIVAIDLLDGQVVRLEKGDVARRTTYPVDPSEAAIAFVEAGARWLHVVDLDAAWTGTGARTNQAAIDRIVTAVGPRAAVEVAGGLRTQAVIERALAAGAARAVLGTLAIADPAATGRLGRRLGADRIAVAVDVRDGRAVGHGWTSGAPDTDAMTIVASLADQGITTFEVTAIDRDGSLDGPDLELYEALVRLDRGAIIASGGIASADDLRAVRAAGCSGAIVGRALYEDRLSLAEAIDAAAT